jgi:predicted RNA-binding Zn-ribbon protein involved in translation (DUF1610 family)
MTKTTTLRTCQQCAGPIVPEKQATAKYCHPNCGRVANYRRKTPEARTEINKRSNDRRFKQDLLPILKTASKIPQGLTPGSAVARWAVACFLIARLGDWKLDLALNFNQCRTALATMAGGECELEVLEELMFNQAVDLFDQQQQHLKASSS